ncbi:acyl-CoA carboxylase subunit epsilon [Nonomuraea sp. K274]|uniref:Acyl-CoA carboxylase subunit epsilon n=1 Tax=Nonomuraea cypriaca TaxID=1187855 RepID=A0A931EWG7_9ACTN|nr:acyl-CoA carboxylase subunit epsilon [Nonomuraea cypriaca]MBF8186694.1 acyl-CoA carboxylase subunit epsilon [Nonomuraea cypriaca]
MTPNLRIVRGDATPEEIAALVAVLAARHAGPESPPAPTREPRRQTWRNPARGMRKPVVPGKSAWRMSVLP